MSYGWAQQLIRFRIKCTNCLVNWGSTLDPIEGAFSAPQIPLDFGVGMGRNREEKNGRGKGGSVQKGEREKREWRREGGKKGKGRRINLTHQTLAAMCALLSVKSAKSNDIEMLLLLFVSIRAVE